MTRPLASLSLDLDNEWSYLKTHGDESWASFPSYLNQVVPRLLDLCQERSLTITVFVVGQDAALDSSSDAMRSLGESGHEIGNHSYHHEPWLHLLSEKEITEELSRATNAIEAATGHRPAGFRGPGFSVSQETIRALVALGYQYDASTLPTFIGPLARAYYLRRTSLGSEDRTKRSKLFGAFAEGFRSIKPYRWHLDDSAGLTEMPVTTMPLLRVPFHATYLIYLARYSEALARGYLTAALRLCRLTGVQPSLLLHSLDLLGGDEVDSLGFFPGMDLDGARKRRLVGEWVDRLAASYHIVTVGEHATRLESTGLGYRPASSLA